jgi:hypothetical protein
MLQSYCISGGNLHFFDIFFNFYILIPMELPSTEFLLVQMPIIWSSIQLTDKGEENNVLASQSLCNSHQYIPSSLLSRGLSGSSG